MRGLLVGLSMLAACGTYALDPNPHATMPPVIEHRSASPAAAVPASTTPNAEPPINVAPAPSMPVMPSPSVPALGGIDEALFRRAERARALGDLPGMRQAFMELVRDHPTSAYVPHAFFVFGDVALAEGKAEGAIRFFEKVTEFPDSNAAPFARYRIAWCRVQLGDDTTALLDFLHASHEAHVVASDEARMLERACLLDSTVAFARAGKLAHAETFYRNVTHGRDIDPEPLLARVAEAAMQGDRGAELAVVCQKNGSPRWCADALAQP